MSESLQLLMWSVGIAAAAGGAYAAVRADLRAIRREVLEVRKTAKEAHRRLDRLFQGPQAPQRQQGRRYG